MTGLLTDLLTYEQVGVVEENFASAVGGETTDFPVLRGVVWRVDFGVFKAGERIEFLGFEETYFAELDEDGNELRKQAFGLVPR